jgi:DNA-binding transcriptional LysR family regulator
MKGIKHGHHPPADSLFRGHCGSGQISQAAIHLHISQSSVTSAIQELEALLGAPLFIRSPQGMILTDSGRHFLNHAYSIPRSVDDAMKSPLPDNTASGSLGGGQLHGAGYFLPHHLQRLSQSYPGIKIHA